LLVLRVVHAQDERPFLFRSDGGHRNGLPFLCCFGLCSLKNST
jgi:hypothetical protein